MLFAWYRIDKHILACLIITLAVVEFLMEMCALPFHLVSWAVHGINDVLKTWLRPGLFD